MGCRISRFGEGTARNRHRATRPGNPRLAPRDGGRPGRGCSFAALIAAFAFSTSVFARSSSPRSAVPSSKRRFTRSSVLWKESSCAACQIAQLRGGNEIEVRLRRLRRDRLLRGLVIGSRRITVRFRGGDAGPDFSPHIHLPLRVERGAVSLRDHRSEIESTSGGIRLAAAGASVPRERWEKPGTCAAGVETGLLQPSRRRLKIGVALLREARSAFSVPGRKKRPRDCPPVRGRVRGRC